MANNNNNEIFIFLSHSTQDYEIALYSESGTFYIDCQGIVQRFEPATDNQFIEEETEIEVIYKYTTHRSIHTFIVPEGVKGFDSGFMRGTRVIDRFELPEGLFSIGNNLFGQDSECNCVFANCILPKVIIPESVKEIGLYAFGHSHIDSIQLPKSLQSPYGRQFKDSFIGTLVLPKEWEDNVSIEGKGSLRLNGDMFYDEKYGYLRWPSTRVLNLKFYE